MNVYIYTDRPQIPTSGLLGYRPLQSDLKDYSGNGKDGSWFSETGTFETVGGYTGARVTEDSSRLTTQHIKLESINYNSLPFTLCGWVRFNTLARGANVKDWDGLITNQGSNSGYLLGVKNPQGESLSYVRAGGYGVGMSNNSNATATTGNWYFIAFTSSTSEGKLYINGQLKVTFTMSAPSGSSTSYWKIGAAMPDGSSFQGTDGWVRHYAMYNRVLTDAEQLEFYNATL